MFLARLAELADRAGGDPPMPAKPNTTHLDDLRALVGNEQLMAILHQHDMVEQQIKDWAALAELAAKRTTGVGDPLSLTQTHQACARSGRTDISRPRRSATNAGLLDPTDLVPNIRKAATDLLRSAVTTVHHTFEQVYAHHMSALEASHHWQQLLDAQRRQLLTTEGIAAVPHLAVGNEADLLRALEQTPLPNWKIKTDALPQQFATAALAAAKLLEPKTQHVHLSSPPLTSMDDIKAWLIQTEEELVRETGRWTHRDFVREGNEPDERGRAVTSGAFSPDPAQRKRMGRVQGEQR